MNSLVAYFEPTTILHTSHVVFSALPMYTHQKSQIFVVFRQSILSTLAEAPYLMNTVLGSSRVKKKLGCPKSSIRLCNMVLHLLFLPKRKILL